MTDETKQPWTPGKWELSQHHRVLTGPLREDFASFNITAEDGTEDGTSVATVYNDAEECTEANARLFMAAPGLAKALADLLLVKRVGETSAERAARARAFDALDAVRWNWGNAVRLDWGGR